MIEILQADITTLSVDAIVNAANETLLGGSGVDGAIHRVAGPELLKHCRTLKGCPTGYARITPGFSLPARFVIHTVGPIWTDGQSNEARLLRSCYLESFRIAQKHGINSIAFPAISTGVYQYPSDQAASVAITAMLEHELYFKLIIACCFNPTDLAMYQRALDQS